MSRHDFLIICQSDMSLEPNGLGSRPLLKSRPNGSLTSLQLRIGSLCTVASVGGGSIGVTKTPSYVMDKSTWHVPKLI